MLSSRQGQREFELTEGHRNLLIAFNIGQRETQRVTETAVGAREVLHLRFGIGSVDGDGSDIVARIGYDLKEEGGVASHCTHRARGYGTRTICHNRHLELATFKYSSHRIGGSHRRNVRT